MTVSPGHNKSISKVALMLVLMLLTKGLYPGEAGKQQQDIDPKKVTMVENEEQPTISQQINRLFTPFVNTMAEVLFWDPFSAIGIYDKVVRDEQGNPVTDESGNIVEAPLKLIVVWLILGGLFLRFLCALSMCVRSCMPYAL